MSRSGQVAGFLPSIYGFRFVNHFPEEPDYTIDIPHLGAIPIGNASNGLCGGMAYAVCDYFHAGQLPPPVEDPPPSGTPLFTYLADRLLDSFNLPAGPLTYYYWMNTPDHDTGIGPLTRPGVSSLTIKHELPKILADIDAGTPSPLNLVQVASANPADLGKNHQVLAYMYAIDDGDNLTLSVYDPNKDHSDADEAALMMNLSNPSHATPITHTLGNAGETVRGFFHGTYAAKTPPDLSTS
jgi:hypothetical protein